jgi:DNA polymerase-3 subunit delta
MPAKSGSTLSANLRIVLLHGKERFLIDERAGELRAALEQAHGEIEVFRFDGERVELAAVLDELRSYGLMQTHKLVILDNADKFVSGKKGDDDEAKGDNVVRRALERYAENPVDHATLVLQASTWRPGNLDKAIAKVGAVIKCEEMRDDAAGRWCIARAKAAYQTALEPAAAAILVERMGTSLLGLDSELDKLSTLTGGKPITAKVVGEVVGRSREEAAWDIQNAILSGSAGEAITKLRELLDISRQPYELLMWSMIDMARKVHGASRLLKQGDPPGAVMKSMRLWGDSGNAMVNAARRHAPAALAQLLHEAIEADARVKRGQMVGEHSLECLAATMADRLG